MLENFFIEPMISKFFKLCFCLGLLVSIPCFLNIVLDSQIVKLSSEDVNDELEPLVTFLLSIPLSDLPV